MLLAYVAVVVILLAPVLLTSVGVDDRNWILERGPMNDGSAWEAVWRPLTRALDFERSPRGTALAISDRSVVALLTMKIAITFSIPPMIVWAALKLTLFALSIVAVWAFLRQVTFRDDAGDVRGLAPRSIAFITIALPVTIAIGAKSQNLSSLNGWNHYPTLTWGTFAGYFLFAALVLKLSHLLQRNFRVWIVVPVALLMVISGIAINLSYEMVALTIPISVLVLLLQPLAAGKTWWHRWRAKIIVLAPLLVSFTSLFIWIRYLMSQRECLATTSCYTGTVLEIRPRTVFYNFVGAMPGNNADLVHRQAARIGRPFPDPGPTSVVLAIVAVLLMWALWASWKARERVPVRTPGSASGPAGGDTRGLLGVILLALCIAAGSSVLTGITERAVEKIQTPLISYRSSVVTWSALALAALVIVLLLLRSRVRPLAWVSAAVLTIVITVAIAMYFPRNVMSAQVNRQSPATRYADTLQLELALGGTSTTADERRCREISAELERRGLPSTAPSGRTTDSAYRAFEFYHGQPYCSTGAGKSATP